VTQVPQVSARMRPCLSGDYRTSAYIGVSQTLIHVPESIPPLPGVSSTTRTKVVSESSRRNAPYPGVTAGDLLGAR
jgi:hypothetical protein